MGLFAFRRLRELEALASAGASFSNAEPTPKLEVTQTAPADGNNNRRNSGRRKRQQLPDAGGSTSPD